MPKNLKNFNTNNNKFEVLISVMLQHDSIDFKRFCRLVNYLNQIHNQK